ncbi:MAG: hypothetical protein LBO03_07310 [Acidaminococcales bacterium]|jgi:hypothetical protein|nr:hypothetical protein [Acidaminococcales bacterium]
MKLLFALIVIFQVAMWFYRLFKHPKTDREDSRRPPVPPPEDTAESERDVAEEEKKFKKWLEDVFGAEGAGGQENGGAGNSGGREKYEDDYKSDGESGDDYENEYEAEGTKAQDGLDEGEAVRTCGGVETKTYVPETRSGTAASAAVPFPSASVPVAGNSRVAAFTGTDMAHGLLMAEIFARPKALRPKRRMFSGRHYL